MCFSRWGYTTLDNQPTDRAYVPRYNTQSLFLSISNCSLWLDRGSLNKGLTVEWVIPSLQKNYFIYLWS